MNDWERYPCFGLSHYGAVIRDDGFVKQKNMVVIATVCTSITISSKRLADVSACAELAAVIYSFSARASYIFSTTSSNTLLAGLLELELVDKTMNEAHKFGLGFSPEKRKTSQSTLIWIPSSRPTSIA
jgi:hypothetical protein